MLRAHDEPGLRGELSFYLTVVLFGGWSVRYGSVQRGKVASGDSSP